MRGLQSLRARMTLGFTASFLALITAASTIDYLLSRHAAQRKARERVVAAARLIAHEWQGDTSASGIEQAIEYSREDANRHGWRDALDDISLAVMDNKGKLLGASRYPHPPWPHQAGDRWITASERGKAGIVVAGVDGHQLDNQLRSQAMLLLGFALLSTPIVAGAAWVLVGRTLRPIGDLADQADRASANALSARLVAPSQDAEVRHLVATLNGFLDRLSADTRLREQFYAAAAHELRTPLAVLSASVEVALSRPRGEAEYRETLDDLQGQLQRLIHLAQDLLMLNRLDTADSLSEDKELVDLGDLCRRMLSILSPVIASRNLRLAADFDLAEDMLVRPVHVEMLVRNLLENSVSYATQGGKVSATVLPINSGGHTLQLCIYNDYNSDPSLNPEQWFEPFYRGDPSRSSATGGNGLGLAICRRIADANGWELSIATDATGVHTTLSL